MTKADVKIAFCSLLKEEEAKYKAFSDKARDEAISGEAKQEAKYDTRAIEASYLAGSLARRKDELTIARQELENISLKPLETVGIGALVETLESANSKYYWITENVGGYQTEVSGKQVWTLSVRSGLGRTLLGCEPGEDIEFKSPKGIREIDVISIS